MDIADEKTDLDYDIAIVGGGMVGGTLAWALERVGYSVALIESNKYDPDKVAPLLQERSVVLSYGSRLLLDSLGLWQQLADVVQPIKHIHVSERGRYGAVRLHAEDEAVPALGYVIRNSEYLRCIYNKLSESKRLQLYSPAELQIVEQQPAAVSVTLKNSAGMQSLSCKLLIAADGTQSKVRELLQIKVRRNDYQQAAVIANVVCESAHNNTAYERFTDTGPLALLPLTDTMMAVVYSVDQQDLETTLAWSDEQMLAALQLRFGNRLGRFSEIGPRVGFPLTLVEAETQFSQRTVLMGNAARTLHPVSGQGFNLALRDMGGLIELLAEQTVSDKSLMDADPGAETVLQQFVDLHRKDQQSVVHMTDILARLFRGRHAGLSHLRACGLLAVDTFSPFRHLIARQSMGLNKRLPVLSAELRL